MKTLTQDIRHCGYRLMVRNPEFDRRPSEKQRVPRFIGCGLFESRYLAHDHVRRHFPTYTSKDYRIMGVKVNFAPNEYRPLKDQRTSKTPSEKITQLLEDSKKADQNAK